MRELNKTESAILVIGAVMMVIGSGANLFAQSWAPYVFAMGTIGFVLMQLKQKYDGDNVAIKRLRRMVIISDVCLLLAAVMMFANMDNLFRLDAITYIKYVHNNWVVVLMVAAMLQLYTSHRISKELLKD
ncbi:MAG: hypothetical protein SPG55_06780 [Prevotella sp.]|nr:hypothetical protein [Prevotella sp.]MDD7028880.1 hypothetical protein [Prevotellaceae bacterium]MDD7075808.1 hypothetical protein [Prevotellaceae bacterium]MDY3252051.1 hypothetical protein [Prevotella sp.]MDY4555763.1 hypothetical protein [Prevotella sp.]